MQVVIITWKTSTGSPLRGLRSGTHTYLQAMLDGEWCQVVVTRSDPLCCLRAAFASKRESMSGVRGSRGKRDAVVPGFRSRRSALMDGQGVRHLAALR